ncbi:uncharacterized protein LOC133194932 [Saccostrea echinata]|uniref:uncharacterized protein LOC133194932 n=1 Tax=Saccostrea echinata TaxID=191078 RepID=UPI002A830D49|nr:uncharacterized protein LOC133194932 [Saccostrea echinata]
MDGVKFIPFPKPKTQLEKCQRWVRLCGRKHFTVESIRKETYICSKHFVGGNGPSDSHPDPLPAVSTEFERNLLSAKKKRKPPTSRPSPKKRPRKCLINDEDESQDSADSCIESFILETVSNEHDYTCLTSSSTSVEHGHEIFESTSYVQAPEVEEIWFDAASEVPCLAGEEEVTTTTSTDALVQTTCVSMSDVGTQTCVHFQHIHKYADEELMDRNQMSRKLFLSSVLQDSNSCKFYTGLNLSIFLFLFQWIRPKAEKLNYWRGQDTTDFKGKPSLPSSQRVTWSNYKHHNTLKALISISPTGSFTFISKLFTGSISDRRIVEESGYLEYLEHGDDIMADRGFLIRDLLARRSCTLNIPPYSMGRQLSSRAVTKTRRIASARIHVERAIGRLKTFKILQRTMPLRLHPLFDQVLGVCACICNLDSKLVK